MIVNAISVGDLTANLTVLVRVETALIAVERALEVATLSDDRSDLSLMAEDLRSIARYHKDVLGIP